jgi:hypothetical protein
LHRVGILEATAVGPGRISDSKRAVLPSTRGRRIFYRRATVRHRPLGLVGVTVTGLLALHARHAHGQGTRRAPRSAPPDELLTEALQLGLVPKNTSHWYIYTALIEYIARTKGHDRKPLIVQGTSNGARDDFGRRLLSRKDRTA